LLIRSGRSVGDAALADVSDPGCVAVDMDVGFGHMPLKAFACGVHAFDQVHEGVTIEPHSVIKDVKTWHDNAVEFRKIIIVGSCEERTHDFYDLLLLDRNTLLGCQ
jgi:hypothetical protein